MERTFGCFSTIVIGVFVLIVGGIVFEICSDDGPSRGAPEPRPSVAVEPGLTSPKPKPRPKPKPKPKPKSASQVLDAEMALLKRGKGEIAELRNPKTKEAVAQCAKLRDAAWREINTLGEDAGGLSSRYDSLRDAIGHLDTCVDCEDSSAKAACSKAQKSLKAGRDALKSESKYWYNEILKLIELGEGDIADVRGGPGAECVILMRPAIEHANHVWKKVRELPRLLAFPLGMAANSTARCVTCTPSAPGNCADARESLKDANKEIRKFK